MTVQQRLFADDDSYQNNYIASNNTWDNWYCGDENNSYTIAYRANRAKASVVSLIGGAERTTRVSRRVDMSALQWKVSMVNNVAELTVSVKPSPSYPADMLDEFMKQILYLDVEATYEGGNVTRRFSSNGGT